MARQSCAAALAAAVLLALMPIALAQQAPYSGLSLGPGTYVWASGGAALTQPTVLSSANSFLNLTLTVDAMTVNTGLFSFRTRGYYLTNAISAQGTVVTSQAAWPGPTLRVKPGDTLVITLTNNLASNPTGTSSTCCGAIANSTLAFMPMPNTTNLHFHGLATNPDLDSIYRVAKPGASRTYTIPIPSNHAPGCHWYHSHVHGAVAMHVMGGLVGVVCVDPVTPASTLPSEIVGLTRYNLVLQHVSETTNNTSNDPFKVRSYTDLATLANSTLPPAFSWTDSTLPTKDVYLVNGQMQPRLAMASSTWVIFDVVNAVGDHIVEMEIRTAVNGGTSACEMYVLAYDGVYLNTAPRLMSFIPMAQGQRTSVAVRCNTTGTYYLQTWGDNTETGHNQVADYEIKFKQLLMTLSVNSTGAATSLPATLSSITRPTYLTDLQSTTPDAVWEESVEQTGAGIGVPANAPNFWFGIGTNCTLECAGRDNCTLTDARTSTCSYESFKGRRLTTGAFRHVTKMGTTNQLTIRGRGKSPHPMHLHTMHVQLQADLAGGFYGRAGDWRDTVPAIGTTTVRYPTIFTGEIVVHCHYLYHEDHGMMDTIYVLPADSTALAATTKSCTFPTACSVPAIADSEAESMLVNATTSSTTPSTMPPGPGGPVGPPGAAAASTSTSGNCPAGYGISSKWSTTNNVTSLVATGCPGYSPYNQTTPNKPTCQLSRTFKYYSPPVISSTVTWVSITFKNGSANSAGGAKGTVGLTLQGVAVFGDGDADNRDALVYEINSMDSCYGHANIEGQYHYHSMPGKGCAYNDTAGQHSPIFAVMIDGIPLYGQYGDNGTVPSDLDECGGHTDKTYGFFHYHLPNGMVSPYTVRCLRGCLAAETGARANSGVVPTCTRSATQYDYSTLSLPWVAGLATSSCSSSSSSSSSGSSTISSGSGASSASVASLFNSLTKQNLTTEQVTAILAKNILRKVGMRLSLVGIDYNEVTSNATKMSQLKVGVCATAVYAATVAGSFNASCTVDQVLPGSVITVLSLQGYEANETSNALQLGATAFATDPLSFMRAAALVDPSSSLLANFNVTSASATVTDDGGSSSKTAIIVGATVGGVVGVIGLIAVAIFAMRSKKRVQDENAGQAPITSQDVPKV